MIHRLLFLKKKRTARVSYKGNNTTKTPPSSLSSFILPSSQWLLAICHVVAVLRSDPQSPGSSEFTLDLLLSFSRQGQGQGRKSSFFDGTRKSANSTAHAAKSTETTSTWQPFSVVADTSQLPQHPTFPPRCDQFTPKSNFGPKPSLGSTPSTKSSNSHPKPTTGTTPSAEFPGPDGERTFPGST